jgi:hypothetical protein
VGRRWFSVVHPWIAFAEKMSFWGDQKIKNTDVFIRKASGTRGLNFVEPGYPVFSLKRAWLENGVL